MTITEATPNDLSPCPSRGPLTTRMDPEVKAVWLEALKSGKYRQGQHVLAMTVEGRTQHCCLGVLAELAVEAGIIQRHGDAASGFRYGDDGDGGWETSTLPPAVADWAGFDGQCKHNPDVVVVDWRDGNADIQRSVSLAEINDDNAAGRRAAAQKVSLYKGDYSAVIPWIEAL